MVFFIFFNKTFRDFRLVLPCCVCKWVPVPLHQILSSISSHALIDQLFNSELIVCRPFCGDCGRNILFSGVNHLQLFASIGGLFVGLQLLIYFVEDRAVWIKEVANDFVLVLCPTSITGAEMSL